MGELYGVAASAGEAEAESEAKGVEEVAGDGVLER